MSTGDYSFGSLNARQKDVVREYVRGRVVHDIGAGELVLSKTLIDLGAREVIAIEWASKTRGRLEYGTPYENILVVPTRFGQYDRMAKNARTFAKLEGGKPLGPGRPIDIAFVSWPSPEDSKFRTHSDYSILGLVRRAKIVIYLGKNTDGTMCGSKKLYEHLARRRVLAHEPDRKNSLIVYDGILPAGKERELLPEEIAGLDPGTLYRYDDLYRKVTARELLQGRR